MDIITSDLCIKRLITVIQSQNGEQHKLIQIRGRHSDALVYILSGRCTYGFEDGSKVEVVPGDVIYLPYRAVYTMYIHTADYRFIFCDFEFSGDIARRAKVFHKHTVPQAELLFERLLHAYSHRGVYADCMAALYSIYGMIQNIGAHVGNRKEEAVAAAKGELDAGFQDVTLSISSLAEKARMSEVYFRKVFKQLYGVSPARYLTLVRLKNAKTLMRYPFLTLQDCALQSGFSSQQYFNRVFKAEMGMSPGQYRKQ